MSEDYKSTVFLPRTDFPMRAGLPRREPEILARWEEMDLYRRQRAAAEAARSSSFTTARPSPTGTCTWATP